jgi:hypothetical protein
MTAQQPELLADLFVSWAYLELYGKCQPIYENNCMSGLEISRAGHKQVWRVPAASLEPSLPLTEVISSLA